MNVKGNFFDNDRTYSNIIYRIIDATAIAVPLGILLTKTKTISEIVMNIGNSSNHTIVWHY
ncbi:hypothetical protein ACVPOQ_12630 [Staphylococcus aureus]